MPSTPAIHSSTTGHPHCGFPTTCTAKPRSSCRTMFGIAPNSRTALTPSKQPTLAFASQPCCLPTPAQSLMGDSGHRRSGTRMDFGDPGASDGESRLAGLKFGPPHDPWTPQSGGFAPPSLRVVQVRMRSCTPEFRESACTMVASQGSFRLRAADRVEVRITRSTIGFARVAASAMRRSHLRRRVRASTPTRSSLRAAALPCDL